MRQYAAYLNKYARNLRKEMTPQERKLWYEFLRRYQVKFRRQAPAGEYILDFYCAKAGLAVELDGSQHFEPAGEQADELRTEKLAELGIKVIRYNNLQIMRYFTTVCEEIDRVVKERLTEFGRA